MAMLTYIAELVRDNLIAVALFAVLLLVLSPYQIWKLLTNNRPARDSGWKMWLADRYIQIWLAREPLDSGATVYDLRMPTGLGDTVFHHAITRKTIDQALEKLWLVKRYGDTVVARRSVYLFMCNWLTYVFCKWFLILVVGDSRQYYEKMSHPPSRIEKIFKDAVIEFFSKALKVVALLALLFLWLKLTSWLLPYLPKLIELVTSNIHFEAPEIKIPTGQ